MTNNTLIVLLRIAGLLHLGLIGAGALMPRTVGIPAHLVAVPAFLRRLFWVYYAFIGLCLVSFGSMTFGLAGTLAGGGVLAKALCSFFATFWTLRLVAATFVFDVKPYLTSGWLRLGYQATNVAFIYLPIVYVLAVWKGGAS